MNKGNKILNIVYKTFKSINNFYVYDRDRHKILVINQQDYDSLNGQDEELKTKTLEKFQKHGFLLENRLKKIVHPMIPYLKEYEDTNIEELIIQVTQKCNLRCGYCFYGENNYTNRTHTHLDMSFETAKKAIDYALTHSRGINTSLSVAFYGGEPLINFDLIKQCISYIENKTENKKMRYSMTTNGTLLTDEIIEYLMEKDFKLLISLDGIKETHDMNRKFVNGQGSYDTVMSNIKHIKEKYPEFVKNISYNTVISPQMDVKRVEEYYENDRIIKDTHIQSSLISDYYTDSTFQYDDKYLIEQEFSRFKALLYLLGRLEIDDLPVLFKTETEPIEELRKSLQEKLIMPEAFHHGGPCIAGTRRLFVSIKGVFYPCERVSEESELMKIGNIEDGVDLNKVKSIINIGELTENKCKSCWALLNCKICAAATDELSHFSREKKLKRCEVEKRNMLSLMKDICMLKEINAKV